MKSGRLSLWLRAAPPTCLVHPRDILYSIPTIVSELPASDGSPADGSELVMHEDDWRQSEWIARSHRDLIQYECSKIDAIRRENAGRTGFTSIHLREAISSPLSVDVRCRDEVVRSATRRDAGMIGVRFRDSPDRVRDGFAVALDRQTYLYGIASQDRLRVLGTTGGELSAELVGRISDLLDAEFVEWRRPRSA